MSEEFNNIELIEAWLNGQLSEEEKSAFEKRMKEDPDFSKEVEMYQDMMRGIDLAGEERIREASNGIERKLESEDFFKHNSTVRTMTNNTKTKPIGRWLAIAASLLVLVAAATYFFGSSQESSPQMAFEKYYQPDKKNLPEILDRLEAPGLASADKSAADSLAGALELYQKDQYTAARSALGTYLDNHPEDQVAKLYMGLSQLQLGEYAKASKHLVPLVEQKDFAQLNMAKWYLALCYSQFGTASSISNAKGLLQDLADDPDSGYYKEALGYLEFL